MRNQKNLQKIINYIDTILKYTENLDYARFRENSMMVEACVFNLSQIGELVNKLDKTFMLLHDNIPWAKIRGLRNRIVHDYSGINLSLIWEIIDLDLVRLREDLRNLID